MTSEFILALYDSLSKMTVPFPLAAGKFLKDASRLSDLIAFLGEWKISELIASHSSETNIFGLF